MNEGVPVVLQETDVRTLPRDVFARVDAAPPRHCRDERRDRIVPLGEAHLRLVLREYLEHSHLERNHQGLDNELIDPRAGPANDNGEVHRKQRLGGLVSFYERRAA